jgi:ribosomal-protein-alanine N-acetyltransferase
VTQPVAPLTVKPLRAEDVPAVAAIHVTAFSERVEHSLARAAASLREELVRPWASVWVAWRGPEAVGAIVLWVVADEVHLLDVATHPESRRQGVGRALVEQAIAVARTHGAKRLFLEVRRSNEAAIGLYKAAGFEEVGVRRRYYPDDEDALDMTLTLEG